MNSKISKLGLPITSKPRQPQSLSRPLGKRLLAYATVAGVAASASHAAAEVIYTPVHSYVHLDFPIDLNHDGIVDFRIISSDYSGSGEVQVRPVAHGNRVVATNQSCAFYPGGAAALPEGVLIGHRLSFQAKANCMAGAFNSSAYNGAFLYVNDAYLGLTFVIDGKTHFGWARVHVNHRFYFCGCIAEIYGYAYETVPGKPIIAGDLGTAAQASVESGSLGALALGAPGISPYKGEKQ
jgi:hypothetical protein